MNPYNFDPIRLRFDSNLIRLFILPPLLVTQVTSICRLDSGIRHPSVTWNMVFITQMTNTYRLGDMILHVRRQTLVARVTQPTVTCNSRNFFYCLGDNVVT